MFTVEQRDSLRERVLELARTDGRVTAGALVGSLAAGGGDPYSDLDLTFGVAGGAAVAEVLDDWTRTLAAEREALTLVDLERGPTTYRVFLLPDALQFDLSMTPQAEFRAAGPRFKLLFGSTAPQTAPQVATTANLFINTPAVASDVFGWGVIYALHSRACIERRRLFQAEHYIAAVRDHALSLACLREGRTPVQARGYDDLSTRTLDGFARTHIAGTDPKLLREALAASVRALMAEGTEAGLPNADTVASRLAELS